MLFALLLTIALGVGGNAAVYGFLQGLAHPASPVGGRDGIVSIFGQDQFGRAGPLSTRDYRMLENAHGVFEWIGAVRIKPADIRIDGRSEVAIVASVTPNLAGYLAVSLDNHGIVISHRMWQNEFGGNENAVGTYIQVDNADFGIEGVAPARFDGLYNDQSVDLWMQSRAADIDRSDERRRDLWVLGRLRQGVSLRQAQTGLRLSSSSLGDVTVSRFTGIAPNMARGLQRVSMFLSFSAGAVFFIACINVASFLLGRALKRSHETSIQIALGATRAELLWDLFSDSLILSMAGGAIGLLLGILIAHSLPAFLFEGDAERLNFAPHFLPIFAASLVCIVITVICGMLPILGTVTDRPWTVLQREAGSPSRANLRLRSALVVAQITACCMLVISTALLLAGLQSVLKTSAGHSLGDPILLTVQAQPLRGPEIDFNYFVEVEEKAKSVTGLSPLAWTARLPGNQPTWRSFRIQQPSSRYRVVAMDIAWLTPDSLQSLEPVAGRIFGANDQGRRVAIVNEEAAAELFGGQTAGLMIRDTNDLPIEIIGVVKTRSDDAKRQQRPKIYYGYLDQSKPPRPITAAKFRVPVVPPTVGFELSTDIVSANYFGALDMPLIMGRKFLEHPVSGEGRVAVINQEAANFYFNGKPLGSAVVDDRGVRTEIVGVVKSQVFGTFEQHAEPAIYFPIWQDCPARMTLILKASQWNKSIAASLRHEAEGVPGRSSDPIGVHTFDTQLAQSGLAALRIASLIGGVSAASALLLSILGVLSAQGDAERQLQRDRALRVALGAQRWRIVFLVLKNAGQLALFGVAIGTSLSFALWRLLIANTAAIGSPSLDTWLIAPTLPAVAVILASALPAQRASLISPSAIMRHN